MKTSAELKAMAKEQLKGRWIQIVLATVVIVLVSGGVSAITGAIPVIGWVIGIAISAPLSLGMVIYNLKFATGETPELVEVFSGFNRWLDSVILNLLITIFTLLWSLLFVIPGIIKAISYSMAEYILAENPDMKPGEALEWSKKITNGHKGRIFWVELSFIGWGILASITVIGLFWLIPYVNITMVNLYNEIKCMNDEYKTQVLEKNSVEFTEEVIDEYQDYEQN